MKIIEATNKNLKEGNRQPEIGGKQEEHNRDKI
jgi:hypothetical protein